jgi:hypothetical protein
VAVDVRALRPCEPSAVCIVRVIVQVRPHHLPLSVAWKFDLVNRCSGSSVNQPGATTVVPPGAAEAVGLESLALPAARSLVVTAVTNAPSRTTSPALLVPAVGGSC